jgi:hypothetical protein
MFVKDHVKSVLRIRSAHTFCAGLHSNGRDPTVGMLLNILHLLNFLELNL